MNSPAAASPPPPFPATAAVTLLLCSSSVRLLSLQSPAAAGAALLPASAVPLQSPAAAPVYASMMSSWCAPTPAAVPLLYQARSFRVQGNQTLNPAAPAASPSPCQPVSGAYLQCLSNIRDSLVLHTSEISSESSTRTSTVNHLHVTRQQQSEQRIKSRISSRHESEALWVQGLEGGR